MTNRIYKREEMTLPIAYYETNLFYIVTLNGNELRDKVSFFNAIETGMRFPESCNNNLNRFDDWMTDLSWIPSEMGVCIIINNYSKFLASDITLRNIVIEDFQDNILPFWEKEVLNCIKDGKQRRFDIILN